MYDNEQNITKSVAEAARRVMEGIKEPEVLNEALKGDQHKLDKNKNNKVDAEDFKILRGEKKMKEETELTESHFKVGDKVKCKASGMKGEVIKLDKEHGEDDEKYYTVKKEDGKEMKFAPNELSLMKEENELEEGTKMQIAKGRTRNVGTYGQAKGADFGGTDWDKEESGKEDKPKRAKYGSRQNYVRSKRVNESFSEMISAYKEGGLKVLASMVHIEEEVEHIDEDIMSHITLGKKVKNSEGGHSQDVHHKGKKIGSIESYKHRGEMRHGAFHDASGESTVGSRSPEGAISDLRSHHAQHLKSMREEVDSEDFEKEMKDQKDKFDGKKKGADVAKASVQAVKNEEIEDETFEVELVLDGTNGYAQETVQERSLTDAEMKKKEDVVMSMKKNVKGFKDRYGDRAKEVIYATATKMAKEEKEDHWHSGYNHVREPISDEPYLDNARGRFHELKKNNPHKRGTPEHKEWHSGASAAYEEHKDILKGN